MTFATSLAVSLSRPRRMAAALLLVTVLGVAGAAVADEQIYVWRDGNGAVRFTSVEQRGQQPVAESEAVERASTDQCRAVAN